ncbi:hypothetical protein M422DRAFT_257888 [Sphaerobolus stellatus SS14]|uniref:NAD(P)-binding domain-containing protein n=1 Tax=Sphaerobolus stellatus (strain SS14) TaxID=990650 RepID=A0A0C9VCQ0_SPHS4|nr:hypothetical protein M422DRAFT_257888 [Sphaerobolus stellatus SS14]
MSQPKVYLVTGASPGFERAVTEYVLAQGDIVVATLRKPEAIIDLSANLPSPKSKKTFGYLDVVYNYAGYGILVVAETTLDGLAKDMFEVNFWRLVIATKEAQICGRRLLKALSKELKPEWNIKLGSLLPSLPAYEDGVVDRIHEAFLLTAGVDPAKPAREGSDQAAAGGYRCIGALGRYVELRLSETFSEPGFIADKANEVYPLVRISRTSINPWDEKFKFDKELCEYAVYDIPGQSAEEAEENTEMWGEETSEKDDPDDTVYHCGWGGSWVDSLLKRQAQKLAILSSRVGEVWRDCERGWGYEVYFEVFSVEESDGLTDKDRRIGSYAKMRARIENIFITPAYLES